jgi:probable rRNA maturation factor
LAKNAGLDTVLRSALTDLGLTHATVNCRPTTASEVRRLNRLFAGEDHATDVLAFPAQQSDDGFQLPETEACLLGDIVISVATASAQAELLGNDPAEELRLLAVHGLLHLLGHDHAERGGADRMTEATQALLDHEASRRGVSAPRAPELLSQP